jgi:hypothetical protein
MNDQLPQGKPVRVQLRRTKGWRMPPNTVSVARPGPWGNPWRASPHPVDAALCVELFRRWCAGQIRDPHGRGPHSDYSPLRGKNLACWCKPGDPCHADVLLELANAEPNVGRNRNEQR